MEDDKSLPDEVRFPECFNQTQVDPRTRKRSKPMEVLCIGMMRTGTASMKDALKILGYDGVYHMESIIRNPPDANMWKQAINAKYYGKGKPLTREEWDQLLGETQACLDLPAAAFMPELIAAYPNAKVIISQRDPEKWFTSVQNTVARTRSLIMLVIMPFDGHLLRPWLSMVMAMMAGVFGRKGMDDKENAIQVYNALHDEVRALVPENRRLEYKLGDGWGPLCEFLGREVPDSEFPRVNETASFQARFVVLRREAMKRLAKNAVPWVVGAAALGTAAWFRYVRR